MGARPGRGTMRGHLSAGRMPAAAAVWHRRVGGCVWLRCFLSGLLSPCGSLCCTLAAPASALVAALALRPPGGVMQVGLVVTEDRFQLLFRA